MTPPMLEPAILSIGMLCLLQRPDRPDLRQGAGASAAEREVDAASGQVTAEAREVSRIAEPHVVVGNERSEVEPLPCPRWLRRARRMHEHEVLGGRHVAAVEPLEHATRVVGRGSLRRVGEEHHAIGLSRARFLPCTASRCAHEHDEPARSFGAVDRVGERRLGVVGEGSHAQHGRLGADAGAERAQSRRTQATSRVSPAGRIATVPIPDSVRPVRRSFIRFATIRAIGSAMRGVRSITRSKAGREQTGQLGVADRNDRCRAGRAGEEAELADRVAPRELPDDDRLAGLVGEQRAKAAADDHVEAVGLLALAEEGLASRDLHPFDVVEKLVELGVAEAGDQVHGRDGLACASRAVDDLHDRESFAVR